jgi:hypothetical protein
MVDSTQTEAKEICHRCGTRWCTAHYSGEAISQAVRKATLPSVIFTRRGINVGITRFS